MCQYRNGRTVVADLCYVFIIPVLFCDSTKKCRYYCSQSWKCQYAINGPHYLNFCPVYKLQLFRCIYLLFVFAADDHALFLLEYHKSKVEVT